MKALDKVGAILDVALYVLWWVLLLVGLVTQNWWVFAPAAFFILLNKLDEL